MRDGWHRAVSRDGVVAVLLVSGGRVVECSGLRRQPATGRASRRFIGTVEQVAERARRRALERELALLGPHVGRTPWARRVAF